VQNNSVKFTILKRNYRGYFFDH